MGALYAQMIAMIAMLNSLCSVEDYAVITCVCCLTQSF